MVRRVRHPRFDGYVCLVKECTCVDYKHGLCRKHWHQVPLSDRMSIMSDVVTAAYKAAKRHDARIAKWAANYPRGVAASSGYYAAAAASSSASAPRLYIPRTGEHAHARP